jgi:predicted ATPase
LITQVKVSGFKGVKNASITLPRLTIFVGENGTGKSTVIQALSILKKSKRGNTIVTELPYVNLGPLPGLVAAGNEAAIEIEGTTDFVPLDRSLLEPFGLNYSCRVTFDAEGLSSHSTSIKYGKFQFGSQWSRYGPPPTPSGWNVDGFTFNLETTNSIGRTFELRGYAFPPDVPQKMTQEYLQGRQVRAQAIYKSLETMSLVIDSDLERFFVVPPLRGFTEPAFAFPASPTQDLQFRTPNSQMQVAANLKYWEDKENEISQLLSQIVGVGLAIRLDPGPTVRIVNSRNGVNFVNEGFGANQLLWVFERIVNSPDRSIIAIEEPETQLHPKAQFSLGKLLCELPTKEKKLVLLSHSPHLVSGVLTAIKSRKIKTKDVALYFFEKKETGIEINRAVIDEQGTVTQGLKSFMEAAASELIEYASAGS